MTPDILDRLGRFTPTGDGPHTFECPLPGGRALAISAERADGLSVAAREVALRSPDGPVDAATLTKRAVTAAERVTGLLEPLAVYEIDAGRGEALLRSKTPAARGGKIAYYELSLRGAATASLKRYQASKDAGAKREAVPFALTHEAVAKFAEDLAGE